MGIRCVWEHNGADTLLYAENEIGAFARGKNLQSAKAKLAGEVRAYRKWRGDAPVDASEIEIVQEKNSELSIRDADSDVLFESERQPLSKDEYETLKSLVLKSAGDFQTLYNAIPDKNRSDLPLRKTFYGPVPRTAEEMYRHTKNVNEYYFWEIGVDTNNEGTIVDCRKRGFALLEAMPGFLNQPVRTGSYGEAWSLRKLLRRFLWHDRIHAKAMYRMAVRVFGKETIPDIFCFDNP